jgi:hypothetical protein
LSNQRCRDRRPDCTLVFKAFFHLNLN